MLRDYRDWLESELKLLGNASHHAYAFGQANMAKRALEKFDDELAKQLYVPLDPAQGRRVLTAIEMLRQRSTAEVAELEHLCDAIKEALLENASPPGTEPIRPGTSD